MGYAISSLQEAVGAILDNPMLLVGIGVTSLLGSILYLFVVYIPVIGMFVAWIIPALMLAAMLTIAYEGLHGTPRFDHLLRGLEDYAATMLGAFVAIFAANLAAWFAFIALAFGLVFAGAFSVEAAAEGADPALFGALGYGMIALIGLAFVIALVVGIVIQFFDAAIVVGDAGVVDAFTSSWSVVRSNPISVLGYTTIRWILGWIPLVLAVMAGFVTSLAGSGDQAFLYGLVGGFLAFVVVAPVAGSLAIVYHVSYFDQASGNRTRPGY